MFKWIATAGLMVTAMGASAQILVTPTATLRNGKPMSNYTPNPLGSNAIVSVEADHTLRVTSGGVPTFRGAGVRWVFLSKYYSFVSIHTGQHQISDARGYSPGSLVDFTYTEPTFGNYSVPPGEWRARAETKYEAHIDGSGSATDTRMFVVQPYG